MSELNNILYVDDELGNLTVFEAAFEDDYEIFTAESGAEALEILAEEDIEVLITDMRMPGMSGTELLERVQPLYPDIPRIVLTGYTDVESVVGAVNSGRIYRYITKPWDEQEMRVIIDRAVATYQARKRQHSLLIELEELVHREETVRTIFQRYVPPQIVEQMLDDMSITEPGAEGREVTLLFADIRGFTPMCHGHPPNKVLRLMNEYFAAMTGIIDKHDGVVSQFRGDAFLAVFGAPIGSDDTEGHAVSAGLEMLAKLRDFNRTRTRKFVDGQLQIGIGVQSGFVAVGNVGCADKVVYSVIGDAAEQVLQVEALCKQRPDTLLTTEQVINATGERFKKQQIDVTRFTGDSRDVRIFQVTEERSV